MSMIVRAIVNSVAVEGASYGTASIVAGVVTFDLSNQTRLFYLTNNADITSVSIINAPDGVVSMFTVIVTSDGSVHTQNWTAGSVVIWGSDQAPEFTAITGHRDVFSVMSDISGDFWYGMLNPQNYTVP